MWIKSNFIRIFLIKMWINRKVCLTITKFDNIIRLDTDFVTIFRMKEVYAT